MHAGDVLVASGTLVTPLLAAHIASGNNVAVEVLRRPRVAFLPTGNELVDAGGDVPRGKNIESNSLLMAGKIEQWGGEPVLFDIVPDNREALAAALCDAAACSDIIVLNAGSSKGSDDYCIEVLEELGCVFNHETNHGPGHHSSYGLINGVPVVGISGPPGGAAFTTDFYLYPLMRAYLGLPTAPKTVRARLAQPFPGPKAKHIDNRNLPGEKRPKDTGTFFSVRQMVVAQDEDGALEATPLAGMHPKPPVAETANAYYFLDSSSDVSAPDVGTFIEVEYRPGFGL